MNFYISTDKSKIDIKVVFNYLSKESYWGKGRSLELIQHSIDNSLCYSILTKKGEQVGFARVISDFSTFAYLAYVFVLPEFQGNGLGKMLIKEIIKHPQLENIRHFLLATQDAHGLYEQFGFKALNKPEKWMEKKG